MRNVLKGAGKAFSAAKKKISAGKKNFENFVYFAREKLGSLLERERVRLRQPKKKVFEQQQQKREVSEFELAKVEILPTRVNGFDKLLDDHGLERGSTILVSGGAGTGKTTFCIQSLYYGALNGEKGLYISFEEEPKRIRTHMKKNFGWDLVGMEKKGMLAIVKFDPVEVARTVEAALEKQTGLLRIELEKIRFPIIPDRIAVDSLSALSIEFESEDNFRKYLKELFEILDQYNSVNYVISETEQDPKVYSRTGVEEFLADGVVVLYNIKSASKRINALEILKLRSGKHLRKSVPYEIGKDGVLLFLD